MQDEEEAQIDEESMLKPEEHKRARPKVGEEVLIALKARRQSEEEENLRLKSEEEARIYEEARMEAEE